METQAQQFKQFQSGNLTLDVFIAAETSFGVTSTIISGKTEAILIDAQFTLAEAEVVAEHIKSSGKKLSLIYISYADPDFYFGLEVFKRYFPEVTVYANDTTIEHIKATSQKKLDVWGGRLGNALTKNVVLPQLLKDSSFELEDEKIEIYGLEEFSSRSFVWIPSIKAVIGGINIFGSNFNLWTADAQTPDARGKWIAILDKITALAPSIVIPAHTDQYSAFDTTSVSHTKNYLLFYEEALKANKTSGELVDAVKSHYPDLKFDIALQIGAKVNTGEMKW
ncbi:MBL fold metallo-hydrolase [Mucilaginibacter rubeus]|uniref:MBL fold metallo-hydrolase n=1 Tax=Mucilaginibacter rubeus TaxID=2027860 RepID=UPI0016667455|nr:MBL fold metallo-hydrolase [Mucilaginibacter rubeus]GGB18159.1 MBL fold metallo-hydrolase [Mucilaginibacter rubeus]